MQNCSPTLRNRIKYIGNYQEKECKIQIFNVTDADKGLWTCRMESYVLGILRGNTAQANITVVGYV